MTNQIRIEKHPGVKCPRCWHHHYATENFGYTPEEIAADPKLADEHLCNSCLWTILCEHPNHPSVPHILENLKQRGLTPQEIPV